LQLVRRFRLPALFCAMAVLVCELVSRPYAEMGISDDWSYILSTQKLVATGHIIYVGWSAAMVGWQFYLGALFVKLFGFSHTTVRMSTLLLATILAFLLQRILVRADISERNATIGTLALVLSPLYLMLSVTFMTDIPGLLAIVLCLYGCIRALQSRTDRAAIGWLFFAVLTNAVCGTSRQLAWLGVLVMLPSTLWLLRDRRRVLFPGIGITFSGVLFIAGCMHWLKLQPYTLPERLVLGSFPAGHIAWLLIRFFLDFPFLLLPIMAVFLLDLRHSSRRVVGVIAAILIAYFPVAMHHKRLPFLEPTTGDWNTMTGFYAASVSGDAPRFIGPIAHILLTIVSLGGLIGLVASFVRTNRKPGVEPSPGVLSWPQLSVLLIPFSLAYIVLLVSRAIFVSSVGTPVVIDRYALGLLVVSLIFLLRYYQERIAPQLPMAGWLMVAIMAIYGTIATHNMFSLYRARVALAAEIRAAGIPDTSVDNGWEYNMRVELDHSNHINDSEIELPANTYVRIPPPTDTCPMTWYERTPHVHPLFGISYDPNYCYGPAPFTPLTYSRWPGLKRGTLYVVKYKAQ
jgi:hypothetical protein